MSLLTVSYYRVRPLVPRWMQILARRQYARRLFPSVRQHWPIPEASSAPPPGWTGWPGGKKFALVLTHDIESRRGVERCERLAEIEQRRGLSSSFGFVPLRYDTPEALRASLRRKGFGITTHGLYHDGKEFRSRRLFDQRRQPMNDFLNSWQTRGFSAPSSLHNLSWIGELDIDYDTSTFDHDPFEPVSCQTGRIFPFWVRRDSAPASGFVELPYTLPQDFTVYVLLGETTGRLWRAKLDWIARQGGMALIKTHPDYMAFDSSDRAMDTYPVRLYTEFLDYALERYGRDAWIAQPSEVARFWRGLATPGGGGPIQRHEAMCPLCASAHARGRLTNVPSLAANLPELARVQAAGIGGSK